MSTLVTQADCREWLASLPESSVDAIVTDPPYELGFMGKRWDSSGIAFDVAVWEQCLRVLKPGGHVLAFSGTRTYHRMAVAIEDAGFDIRDQLAWMYGTGFPKSLDVSKAIDKAAGVEREVIGKHPNPAGNKAGTHALNMGVRGMPDTAYITAPATTAAIQWAGWGTALKPAQEPICLARKPLIGTVAANVLAHGTGGINVDGCRIGCSDKARFPAGVVSDTERVLGGGRGLYGDRPRGPDTDPGGRWPANVLLDETAAAMLDAQSGISKDGVAVKSNTPRGKKSGYVFRFGNTCVDQTYGGFGGASRFFYVAKASKGEREAGLDHMPRQSAGELTGGRAEGSAAMDCPRTGAGRTSKGRANTHPTVKPIALMRYLCRLITPPGGLVIDPFAGSGTTGCAALIEGFVFLGCDLDASHVAIANARIAHWAARSMGQQELL